MAEGTSAKESKNAPSSAPVPAGRLQAGEATSATLTTKGARGVDELPANQVADEPGAAALQKAVQKTVDEEQKQGFRGANTDPTPNENYTVKGVLADKPTPETVTYTPKGV